MIDSKYCFVLWDPEKRSPEQLQSLLTGSVGVQLLQLSPKKLTVLAHDPTAADVQCPAPPKLFEARPCGQVSIWQSQNDVKDAIAILRGQGFIVCGYEVEETVYTDYGDNCHGAARDWPDGTRSPGVMLLTLMERPRRLSKKKWLHRWYERQSPMSEAMQPRPRYVRNLITARLTENAYPLEGIVEEAWPSKEHVENPYLFYGADNRIELVKNQLTMLTTVSSFLNILRLRTTMVGEYFLKS